MGIFDKRVSYKPFEYPEMDGFVDAINHSIWFFTEYNYDADIHDFCVNFSEAECNAIKNAMLAISQIEVSVKEFWSKLSDKLPKPEIQQVGATFAESEVRHARAYSHLLNLLGLNDDFQLILNNPVIQGRVDYLSKYLKGAAENTNQSFILSLTLFSLFIENISLFSQFLIIKSFNKHKNSLKGMDNAITATAREENLHALFGAHLISIVKEENPEWFDEDFYEKIYRASKKAYAAECNIVDWIFEKGDLDFISALSVKEYIKKRFNKSMEMIGGDPVFEVDETLLEETNWFDPEVIGEVNTDFFHKRPTSYSRKTQSYTAEDLF